MVRIIIDGYLILFSMLVIWISYEMLPVGTKSLLVGVHCWFIHPFTVALAWKRLYGFPWDPRLWIAFFVHDWGYWGHREMDSEEAEKHVELGARIMHCLCDMGQFNPPNCHDWEQFTLYHSRFYAKKNNAQFSRLCVADKAAFYTEPYWFYMLRARLSGEVWEYLGQQPAMPTGLSKRDKLKWWHAHVTQFLIAWVNEHKDCKPDDWTDASGDRKSVIPTTDTSSPIGPLEEMTRQFLADEDAYIDEANDRILREYIRACGLTEADEISLLNKLDNGDFNAWY